jgi:hypothetical protein
MSVTRTRAMRAAMLATLGGATLMLSAATRGSAPMFGGPWISIEAPVNPYDASTRGALFLVHTFHHGAPEDLQIVAKAEGLLDGQRKSVTLTPSKTAQAGTQGVRNEWGSKGVWTVLVSTSEHGGTVQAVVDIDADGAVGRVTVPMENGRWKVLSAAEIDRSLRERARAPLAVGRR